jgi:hypothetical protein
MLNEEKCAFEEKFNRATNAVYDALPSFMDLPEDRLPIVEGEKRPFGRYDLARQLALLALTA